MRYAYLEMKYALARLLTKYSFEVTPLTPKTLKVLPFNFATTFEQFPLKVVKR